MLCKIGFQVSGEVVALHLDNSNSRAYLCSHDGTAYRFLSRVACCILNLAKKNSIIIIPAYITYKSHCGRWLSITEKVGSRVASPSSHSSGLMSTSFQPEVGLLASSFASQCQHYYGLENPLTLWAMVLNAFNHTWTCHVSYVFPSTPLVLRVLSKFLEEHITGQFRLLILVALCCREAPWLSTFFGILEDIPHSCHHKNVIMDVSVDQVVKGLPLLHFTLWLLRDLQYTDKVLLLCLSGCDEVTWVSTTKVYQQCWKEMQVDVLKRVYQTMPIMALNWLHFWFTYLGLHWFGIQLVFISLLLAFWNPIINTRL